MQPFWKSLKLSKTNLNKVYNDSWNLESCRESTIKFMKTKFPETSDGFIVSSKKELFEPRRNDYI